MLTWVCGPTSNSTKVIKENSKKDRQKKTNVFKYSIPAIEQIEWVTQTVLIVLVFPYWQFAFVWLCRDPPTDAFAAAPVSCKMWAWCIVPTSAAAGVFSVSKSRETNQVINNVMKTWNYLQSVMEGLSTYLVKVEQQNRRITYWQKVK